MNGDGDRYEELLSTDADVALVFVSVTARADTADRARTQVARDAREMRSALHDAGIPDDAVTTSSFNIFPRFASLDREAEIIGYSAVHAFRIEAAPERAGEVIDFAVANGADEVTSVQFTLREETRASLREQALTSAVEGARADADTVAAAAGLSITGVAHVSTSGGVGPVFDGRFDERDAGGAPTVLEPGPVTVEATVSITYTAECGRAELATPTHNHQPSPYRTEFGGRSGTRRLISAVHRTPLLERWIARTTRSHS